MKILEQNRLEVIYRLCCYIEQLEKIQIELKPLEMTTPPNNAGPAVSQMAECLFDEMSMDPNIVVLPEECPCVFGVNLVRKDGSRYRIFDKEVKAIMEDGTSHSVFKLSIKDTVLFSGNGKTSISYSQAICWIKQHFMTVKNYLQSIKGQA